jgi:P27 family predicted phage terminase small subunit
MKTPAAQAYLSKEGKQIYKEICRLLEDYDALEEIDSYILSMTAHYLDLFHKHADKDPIQTYPTGAKQVSPSFSIMKDAREGFIKLSGKLGLSNKDRELMLKFKAKKDEGDALDDI